MTIVSGRADNNPENLSWEADMDRQRIQKARRISKDLPLDAGAGMGEFLDVAANMADETQTYPVGDEIFDLDELDDSEYDEILDAHEGLEKALTRWTGIIERIGE